MKSYILRDLEVSGLVEDNVLNLRKVSTQKSIPVTNEHIPLQEDIEKWLYLQEVKLPDIDAEIGLLIGNNVHKAFEHGKLSTAKARVHMPWTGVFATSLIE